jgi:hypothetical protein
MDAGDLRTNLIEYGLQRVLRANMVRVYFATTPAAGAEWSITVPAGACWEVLHVSATLATSAVVANRQPQLVYRNQDGLSLAIFSSASSQAASLTNALQWDAGLGAAVNTTAIEAPISTPAIPLQAGWTVRSSAAPLDVGDQWSAIRLIVIEWSPAQVAQAADQIITRYYDQLANL